MARHIAGHGSHISQTAGFGTDKTSFVSIVQTIRSSAHKSYNRQPLSGGGTGPARQITLLHVKQGMRGEFGILSQSRAVNHGEAFGGNPPLSQYLFNRLHRSGR